MKKSLLRAAISAFLILEFVYALASLPAMKAYAFTGFPHPISMSLSAPARPSTQIGATAITVGKNHSCALTTKTTVKCWGDDTHGQLGDGRSGADKLSSIPIEVSGLISVTAISAGGDHTCALLADNTVKCWGYNSFGQLGNGVSGFGFDSPLPVSVSGLSNVTAISAGDAHTCALAGGQVYCWGQNQYGRIGNGVLSQGATSIPAVISSLVNVRSVASGGAHTCALSESGSVKCWGYNLYGQLGYSSTLNLSIPMTGTGLISVTAITAGAYHSCALTAGYGVKCWGYNATGQIGDNGQPQNRLVPVDVIGLTDSASAVSAGGLHTCALTTGNGVKCWGFNQQGQLGDGTNWDSHTPVDVSGLSSGVKAIAGGTLSSLHTCALLMSGSVMCWGYNNYGQLGNGTSGLNTDSNTPIDVADFLTHIYLPNIAVSP